MGREILALCAHHGAHLAGHRIQLLRAVSGFGEIHDVRVGKLAVDIHGIHGLVAQLLAQPKSDLLGLVA